MTAVNSNLESKAVHLYLPSILLCWLMACVLGLLSNAHPFSHACQADVCLCCSYAFYATDANNECKFGLDGWRF